MQRPELSMPMHVNLYLNVLPMWQQKNSHLANAQVCLVLGTARSAVCDNTLSCGFVLGAVPAAQHQSGDFRCCASDSATLAAGTLGLLGCCGFWSWLWPAAMDTPLQVTHAQHSLTGSTSKGNAVMWDGVQACWYIKLMSGVQLWLCLILIDCIRMTW